MDNDYLCNNPWIGQQPDEADHIIDYLNSDQGIMFPTSEFVESPEVYSDGIRESLREPADADNGLPPLILPPAVDEYDADAEDVYLNDPDVRAYASLADNCWDYILQPLLSALRPLRGLPCILIMPFHFLLLDLYCIITDMDGPFLRQIIPVILVEVAERYEPGAGFLVNVVVGLMPHILEQLRPTLVAYGGRLSDLCDEFQGFLILCVDKSQNRRSRNVC
ncbi:hypothetical protein NOF04DRAFT_18194 [Fusarium oxysporum II5]|uniref:Uncharacterized protein n=3 Tax=Fusarium oxysporum species complex TaxID=171631 RepID=N1SBR9_FUSC4|nr:uncharacterized protein FOIG_15685 [Fusarium odoratissimum NRRL 54006]EMT73975.1 hypothetical protein FOC4_g10001929 [Fusarium odoratissimum]EXL91110.1 hypothetical protein FOIG_15685 [Fusarium odoratissimum NRRL 54006]KAK2127635.1 hypothetical protein NOF04DRAFT_18194 [Fusarium oxysporum II5]TXB99290.1 hypothetical protein FocTR4_00013547 [Fusarium oxysporum f. sp. cubense]